MSRPIEDYALIGDLHSAALVGGDGSIDWLCLPRFDSAACFAALLGADRHGHWRISPADGNIRVRRRYRPDTLVLETEFGTDSGVARLIDCMPPRGKDPVLVRLIEGVSGTVHLRMTLEACFEYGSARPAFRQHDEALGIVAGSAALWLFAPVHIRRRQGIATAELSVSQGDKMPLAIAWRNSREDRPDRPLVPALIDQTERWWRSWVSGLRYDGEWREAVIRSLITVKALTYAPTGGVIAAPTTSLPQEASGCRNWDHRYCWLRDAAATLRILLRSGALSEPDAGIWEVRGPPRQFVHSKVMVWAAANAAVQMIERFGDPGPADRWRRLRAEVRAEVLDRGYDTGARTFVQAYERPSPDASMLPLRGRLGGNYPLTASHVALAESAAALDAASEHASLRPPG